MQYCHVKFCGVIYFLICSFIFTKGNLHSSGSGGTRYLLKNGKNLLWEHISRCYFADLDLGLHQLPKLTIEHIHLTSYAKMRVNLAVQILSKSMAEALRRSMPIDKVEETANFCQLMNDFLTAAMLDLFMSMKESRINYWHHMRNVMIRALCG